MLGIGFEIFCKLFKKKKFFLYFERKLKLISFIFNYLFYDVFKKMLLFDVREDDFLFVIILIDNIIIGKVL